MLKLGDELEIDDTFLDEHVLATSQDLIPWFADFANNLASDLVPEDMLFQQQKRFMHKVRKFFWDVIQYETTNTKMNMKQRKTR